MGDSVDNVPGIFGIGPKTASKLIAEHGSLTAALDAAPDMKPSKIEGAPDRRPGRCRTQQGAGDTERRLYPAPADRGDEAWPRTARTRSPRFLEKHGFTSLLKPARRGQWQPGPQDRPEPAQGRQGGRERGGRRQRQIASRYPKCPAIDHAAYETVQTMAQLEAWIARARAAQTVAVDTETTSLDAMRADLVGVSLALGGNDACYIPLGAS